MVSEQLICGPQAKDFPVPRSFHLPQPRLISLERAEQACETDQTHAATGGTRMIARFGATFWWSAAPFALLLTGAPAIAADIEAKSMIDSVLVAPGAAMITRKVSVDVPAGSHDIILAGLPQTLDPSSLRVDSVAIGKVSMGAVAMRQDPLNRPPEASGAVAERLTTLRANRERKLAEIAALQGKQRMIEAIGAQAPAILGGKDKPVDPAEWPKAWEAVGKGLEQVAHQLRETQTALRSIDQEIAAISRSAGGQRPAVERVATIPVESAEATRLQMTITYRVSGVSWQPAYDAVLETRGAKPALTFMRRAMVTQRTGEDWKDVALAFTTTDLTHGAAAPDLPPLRAGFNEPRAVAEAMVARPAPMVRRRSAQEADSAMAEPEKQAQPAGSQEASAPVEQQKARLETSGYAVRFSAPGRITLAADGSSRSFFLTSREVEPTLQAKAVPSIEPRAFLEANFANDETVPLLTGAVTLVRDGVFVGQTGVTATAPGDTLNLGFGLDDRIRVTRTPIRRRETDATWLQGSRGDLREFRTVIRNLHDKPIRITMVDQIPFSENAALTVELLANSTPPTERNPKDRRGLLHWTHDYKPGEEREIRHGYRMRWPNDREIIFEPAPVPR
jgi:uncharacterized protein (TIGR02231 family)